MGIGDTLSWAWNGATSAAKSAATSVANGASAAYEGAKNAGARVVEGAQYVGQKTVEGAQYVGGKVVDGAQYVGQKTVEGAQYVGGKVVEGAQWTGEKIQQGAAWTADAAHTAGTAVTRGVARGVVDTAGSLYGHAATVGADAANAVGDAYNAARGLFTDKPPEQPCINCSGKDVDHDGCLFGYVNGRCVPLTSKGDPIDDAAIQRANAAAYSPRTNPAFDPAVAAAGDRNTATHTGRNVRACCENCPSGQERTIYYMNGILTNRETHCDTLKQIGDMTCARVVGVYNATEGGPLDAHQTMRDRALIDQAKMGRRGVAGDGRNPAVDTMSNLIVNEARHDRPIEIMAHSQGGAGTSLATFDARNRLAAEGRPMSDMKNVHVTSFGAAAPTWPSEITSTHYVNVNDFTPMNLGVGDYASESFAGGGRVIKFSGEPQAPVAPSRIGDPVVQQNRFATGDQIDRHFFQHPNRYHGISNEQYLQMYQQQNQGSGNVCGCGMPEEANPPPRPAAR